MRLSRSTLSFLAQINNLPWSFIKIRCSSLAAPQKALQSPHRSWGRPGLSSVTSNNALILTDNPYLDRAGEPDIGGSPCHRRPHRHEPASCPTGAPRPLLEAPTTHIFRTLQKGVLHLEKGGVFSPSKGKATTYLEREAADEWSVCHRLYFPKRQHQHRLPSHMLFQQFATPPPTKGRAELLYK